MKVENIIPRNLIINLGCASVDNHIPRDDIFDYHPRRECNIYILSTSSECYIYFIILNIIYDPLFSTIFLLLNMRIVMRKDPKGNNAQPLIYIHEKNYIFHKTGSS